MLETVKAINSMVWGMPLLILLLGTGFYLMLGLKIMPFRKLFYGFAQLFKGRKGQGEGSITPFGALMTSLSATVGTGNIAGVATAIGIGGPGALFWMWATGLVGMATKYAEAVLAVKYRERDEAGDYVGGPMYYIKNGLGSKWTWMGAAFAFLCGFGGIGTGNMIQSNSLAHSANEVFGVPYIVSGLVVAALIAIVILGGVKRISQVASKLVPFMALTYFIAGIWILGANFSHIADAFMLVIESAFSPVSAAGGFIGSSVALAMQKGVERGLLSNEAGQGSAPIAHAAAETNSPVRQGVVAMLGTFIDTLVICSITGLAIVITGVWTGDAQGSAMTSAAFGSVIPGGEYVVAFAQLLFAFSTILGWAYYAERCMEYLFGLKAITPFRWFWVAVVVAGSVLELEMVWELAGIFNGLMALPNLIALLLLSPIVFKATNEFFADKSNL